MTKTHLIVHKGTLLGSFSVACSPDRPRQATKNDRLPHLRLWNRTSFRFPFPRQTLRLGELRSAQFLRYYIAMVGAGIVPCGGAQVEPFVRLYVIALHAFADEVQLAEIALRVDVALSGCLLK